MAGVTMILLLLTTIWTAWLSFVVGEFQHRRIARLPVVVYGARAYLADGARDPLMWAWTPKGVYRPKPFVQQQCDLADHCHMSLWAAVDQAVGPVQAGSGSAWRAVALETCNGPAAVWLERDTTGAGRLFAHWRTKTGVQDRSWRLTADQAGQMAKAVKAQHLERLISDPIRLPRPAGAESCFDGENWVFEEDGPRGYRYVTRNCMMSNYDEVGRAAMVLFRAFYDREPGVRRQIVCSG